MAVHYGKISFIRVITVKYNNELVTYSIVCSTALHPTAENRSFTCYCTDKCSENVFSCAHVPMLSRAALMFQWYGEMQLIMDNNTLQTKRGKPLVEV